MMGRFQNVILKVEQVPPVTKQLPAIDLERKSQNPFPQISNPMVMLLRIQIIWTRMTYRLREKHLQSDSLLELVGKKALNYAELSSGGDSADSDNEIEVPEDLDEKMKSPEVKKESQSEDTKPADSSVRSLSSKKEPLVQATLSSMFKKAEENKRSTSSPKGSPATKGPAVKKQRASPWEKQPAGKSKATGTRKKPKVEDDEIEQLSSSSQDNTVDDDSDEDWAE